MTTKAKTLKKSATKSRRWSLGVFRTADGGLKTVYVDSAGTPAPYLKATVTGKCLYHAVYRDMAFKQARQKLLRESGLKPTKTSTKEAK